MAKASRNKWADCLRVAVPSHSIVRLGKLGRLFVLALRSAAAASPQAGTAVSDSRGRTTPSHTKPKRKTALTLLQIVPEQTTDVRLHHPETRIFC